MTDAVMSRVAFVATLAGLLASCGGSSGTSAPAVGLPSTVVTAAPAPAPAPPKDDPNVSAIVGAIGTHSYLATNALDYVPMDGSPPSTFRGCVFGSGSVVTTVDGAEPPATLPAGNHTTTTTYANCLVDGLSDDTFTGRATVVYSAADWRNVTARTTLEDLRAMMSLRDALGRGSAAWTRTITDTGYAETYTPEAGSSLTNNLTTRTITFQSGSHSVRGDSTASPPFTRWTYGDVGLVLNGVPYTVSGTLVLVYRDGRPAWSGEVEVRSDGKLVGRTIGDGPNLRSEALGPIQPF